MIGLAELIPEPINRYKIIVEECLYFSDINPTNIYITNILINRPVYKTKYNLGNTLDLDIKKKWDIDGFDAVIGKSSL